MNTLNGGHVKSGYYVEINNWEIVPVKNDGDVLPSGKYIKVSTISALIIMVSLGGLMVVFLPFIGLYLFSSHVYKFISSEIRNLLHVMSTPSPAVGSAHFTGSQHGGKASDKLLQDIEAKRTPNSEHENVK